MGKGDVLDYHKGRVFTVCGWKPHTVRFADKDGGACTCTYSFSLTDGQKESLARRIAAALNYTSDMSLEQLERGAEFKVGKVG